MAKLFQGNDRHLLQSAAKLLAAAERRDARLDDPAPTTRLQSPLKLFAEDVAGLVEAKDLVKSHIADLLAATR